MSAAKPKTAEEKDEEKLREAEAKIKELLALLGEGHSRERADERLETARAGRERHTGSKQSTFHRPGGAGKPVPVTRDTASLLELAEALDVRVRLGQYAAELQDALGRYTAQKVEVLERKLKKSRY